MSKSSSVISLRVPNDLLDKMPSEGRSKWILSLIRDNLNSPESPNLESRVLAIEERLRKLECNTGNAPSIQSVNTEGLKATTTEERYELVSQCLAKGMDNNQITEWLNENGYKAQRGPFTVNSVRSIVKKIKESN